MSARVVELAARLGDVRLARWLDGPDVEGVAALAATLPPVEVVRMGNRLRAAVYREAGIDARDVDRVPGAPISEVWDAPVRVWEYAGTVTHITAVSVTPRVYLETYQGGPYMVPVDRFGAQVIARASTAGRPDAFGVFWLAEWASRYDGAQWRQVTGDLTADEMTDWDGLPVGYDQRRHVMPEMGRWLDTVAGDAPAVHNEWRAADLAGAR